MIRSRTGVEGRGNPRAPENPLAFESVVVSGTPYNVPTPGSGQEVLVAVDTFAIGGVSLVNLPGTPKLNSRVCVKDSTGTAGTGNAITISGNGNTIDGQLTQLINSNYASRTMQWLGTEWKVI